MKTGVSEGQLLYIRQFVRKIVKASERKYSSEKPCQPKQAIKVYLKAFVGSTFSIIGVSELKKEAPTSSRPGSLRLNYLRAVTSRKK